MAYRLLAACLLCAVCSCGLGDPSIDISLASSSVIRGQDFLFSCSSTSLNLTDLDVLTDDHVATSDRLTTTLVNSSYVEFNFSNVTPQDNGLEFLCSLDDNGTEYNSANLTLDVIYFKESNSSNAVVWREFLNGTDFVINCTVVGNPSNITITASNTSSNVDNVEYISYDDTSGGFEFTTGVVENAGNYTCTASNGLVTDNITYQVLIGGPPNDANITDAGFSINGSLVTIHFTVTDASDAPARGVLVDIPGLESGSVLFTHPFQNADSRTYSYIPHTPLDETVPLNYMIKFTPFNSLGNGSAVSTRAFLPGSNFHVNISTSNHNLPELTNFTISCITNNPYIKIINLLIDGINSSNYSNVIVTQQTNTSASYIFMNTSQFYNGSNFTCFGQLNSNPGSVPRTSDAIFINVLYAPRFQDYNNCTKWLEFPISSSFNISCSLNSTGNPPLKASISYINTTADFSNVETTLDNTSLVYAVNNATINNRVNLTCVANSSYAVTTANYLAFVGDAPDNVTVTPDIYVDGDMVLMNLSITDNSNAPAKNFVLNISGIYNFSIPVPTPPAVSQFYPRLLNTTLVLFGDAQRTLKVTANNSFGDAVIYNQTLNIPVSSSSVSIATSSFSSSSFSFSLSKSLVVKSTMTEPVPTPSQSPSVEPYNDTAAVIIASIVVPLVVLILLVFIGGTAIYFYRNRKNKGFSVLIPMEDSAGPSFSSNRRNRRNEYSTIT